MFAEYFIFRFLSEIDVISCQSFPTVRESRCCSHENITGGRRRPSSDLITYEYTLALHLYFSSFFLGEEMSAFYRMQGIAVATLTSEDHHHHQYASAADIPESAALHSPYPG